MTTSLTHTVVGLDEVRHESLKEARTMTPVTFNIRMANPDEVGRGQKGMATSAALATVVNSQNEAKQADCEITSPKLQFI